MLVADYSNESPEINVENHNYAVRNVVDLQVGEIQFALREADSKEISEKLDRELYSETRQELEEQIESLNEEVADLKKDLDDSKSYIAEMEAKIEKFKQYVNYEIKNYEEMR